jgi:hypothetical protein
MMTFTCPRCGAVSEHPVDEREGYCGRCHDWTGHGVFGTWDAPATDELPAIPAPVGHRCVHCREQIAADDNGAVLYGGIVHRECHLRVVMGGIGHMVDHARYCRSDLGPDAGLTYRASALLVWDSFVNGRVVTEDDLQEARRCTNGAL